MNEKFNPGIKHNYFSKGILLFILIISLVPIIWIILTSIKTEKDIFSIPPKVLVQPDVTAYKIFLSLGDNSALPFIWNSIHISIITTILTIFVSSLAAYSFSRYHFKWGNNLMILMLATRLLPPVTAVVPLYLMFRYLNLLDTKTLLILIYTAIEIPFATWLMKAFFDAIPKELEESAAIEGCNPIQTIFKITMPLASSGIAATSIFVFILAWNEFMFAFMFTSIKVRTIPVRLAETIGEMQVFWQEMATLATIIMLPALLIGIFMQKYLVSAITEGAVK